MKIALYNLTSTVREGGVETFFWEMGRQLALRGHRVHLYGGHGSVRKDLPQTAEVRTYGFVPRQRFRGVGSRLRKLLERLSFALAARRDVLKGAYDWMIVGKPYDLPIGVHAQKRVGTKVFFAAGGFELLPGCRRLIARVDFFSACSGFLAEELYRQTGRRPVVLYNGVDVSLFRPRARPRGNGTFTLITVGRLRRQKGIHLAIGALEQIKRERAGLKMQYLLVGSGREENRLREQVARSGLTEEVSFLGRVENQHLPEVYARAHLALYPSTGPETFGIAAAEAMACGLPVIVSNRGGLPEVAGPAGIVVEPQGEKLAESVKRLMDSSKEREALGLAARQRVLSLFTWEKVADNLEKIINPYSRKGR